MSDTSIEDQATLALVFDENIRDIVRKHLKLALQDEAFLASVYTYPLAISIANGVCGSPQFHNAVKNVISTQMSKH